MIRLEILTRIGEEPIVLDASQVVVTLPDGSPIALAAVFGGTEGVQVSHCKDPEFNKILKKLGIDRTTVVENMKVR